MSIVKLIDQAGSYMSVINGNTCFTYEQIQKFVDIVRAEALEEAAKVCRTAQAKGLQSIREAIEEAIRGLK